jgi:OmpA-OmpF porin, OOP family
MNIARLVLGLGLGVFLASVAPAGLAGAQARGFAIDRFEPSERGSDWFVLDSLDFRDKHLALGVVADYANKPLVFYDVDGNPAQALVEHQLFVHVGMSLVLGETLRLAANLPIAALVAGQSGTIGTTQYTIAEGGELGDLRLSADVLLVGEYRGPFSFAFGASVWAPTGSREAYTGDGKARLAPHVMLAGDLGAFVYAMKLGTNVRFQSQELAGADTGSEVFLAASMGVRAGDNVLLGPELYTSTVVQGAAFTKEGTPVELLFGAHVCIADAVRLGAGVGPGLNHAFGSPELRAVGNLEWAACAPEPPPPPPEPAPEPRPRDRDGDGIIDRFDACPDEPGVVTDDPKTNGCPPPEEPKDRDFDGVLDDDDACPDEPGRRTDNPATNGCPERDRDKDGILDDDDACPDDKGLLRDERDENGCPDSDRDDIVDIKDACPETAGPPNEDPKKHGCPIARISEGQIRILEQVKFKTNSAEILKESNPVLEAVRDILEQHAKITKVGIEGHTDDVGKAAYNKKLSERRAASVVKWLVRNGIAKERLTSAGFGMDRPLVENDGDEGRRQNRRVEFHIRELDGRPADEAAIAAEAQSAEPPAAEPQDAAPAGDKPAEEEASPELDL